MAEAIAVLVDLCRRRAAVLVASLLALAVLGGIYTVRHISIDTDIDKLMSPDLPWRQREAEMDRAFPQNIDLLAIVVDGASADLAEDASAALAARLGARPDLFRSVRRPESGPFFEKSGFLFLSTQEVQDFADRMIAAQPLLGTLAADPSLRGVFGALDLVAQGALAGEADLTAYSAPFEAVAAATDAAVAGRYAPMSWRSLLTGRTDPHELRRFVLVQPVLDFTSLASGERATTAVRETAVSLGLTSDRGVRVRITGPVALSDEQFASLAEGAGFSTALSLGLLSLWLLLALRSLRLFVAIVVTLLTGLVACATFAVGAVGPLNPISVAFAVLFVGIAVDFGIQFSVRYRDESRRTADRAAAFAATARGIGGPLAVAGAATAAGFLSFVPTDYTGVADLGLIAGAGMVIALILNLTLLPALLTLLQPAGARRPVGFGRLAPLGAFLVRRRGTVIGAALLLALAAAATLPRLSFDFNPLNLQSPRSEAVATLFALMADPMTTPYTIDVLASSTDAATTLANKLGALPEVAQAITVTSFIPEDQPDKLAILGDAKMLLGLSLAPLETKAAPTPAEALAAIVRCAADARALASRHEAARRLADALDRALARGAAALPLLETNLAAGVPRRLEELRLALDAEPVSFATLPEEIKRDWVTPDGRTRVEAFPKGDARNEAVLRGFSRAVLGVAPDATGTPISIQESARTVIHAFLLAGLLALAAIAIMLLAVLRHPVYMMLVLAPLILAGLLTLATSVLVGLPINFANIIALPLLLGIGVAFDIYFVMRWRGGAGDLLQSSTARAILFSALTTGTAFGSLALSNHPGTADMGKLLMLALFYTLLTTFIVLPALLGPVRSSPSGAGSTQAAKREAPARKG